MATSCAGSELFDACRDGNILRVKRFLSTTSVECLNTLELNGNSCLHIACASGHAEVVRLLLESGAFLELKNVNGHTAANIAKTADIQGLLSREEQNVSEHYATKASDQREWLFDKDTAIEFTRAVGAVKIKDRGVKKTVKKLERANVIPNDQTRASKLYRHYLNKALQENNPIFLLKLYTIEGSFYRRLNDYMITGSKREVFKKIRSKWSGYYVGIIMKGTKLADYHYTGRTFRGMEIALNEFDRYKVGITITNKAFQSTSKSRRVTMQFAHRSTPFMGTLPVILIYSITNPNSAFDISSLSEFPDEKEVLIVPGSCFEVMSIHQNGMEYEIHLEQLEIDVDLYHY